MIAEHVPYCYSFVICDFQGKLLHEEVWAGRDAHIRFIERLLFYEHKLLKLAYKDVGMEPMTSDIRNKFKQQSNCGHCHQPLSWRQGKPPARDHCHYSGKLLHLAHHDCNWNRCKQRKR